VVADPCSSQRRAASRFVALAAPAALAIVLAGGGLAFVPLLMLLVPILVLGRAPGVEVLERIRSRPPRRRRRPGPVLPPTALAGPRLATRASLLIAESLAERGPPCPRPSTS
jgi:hypothetical protein